MESLNLLAVIGPYDATVAMAAETLRIPFLCVTKVTSHPGSLTLDLTPESKDIGLAVYDVATAYNWKTITVFYDDERGEGLLEKGENS